MYAINAIKHGRVLKQEPTTKNNLGVQMTNGEKLIETFPSIGLYKKAHDGIQINFNSVWFNAEYKEPTTKNDLGVDCISREQAKIAIRDKFKDLPSRVEINTILNELPSVTPQEPRTGHWTYICNSEVNGLKIVECSECRKRTYRSGNYCPNCGADMRGEEV